MAQSTVEINENLLQIDNVLTGLNYLLEEVQTRKNNILEGVDVTKIIKDEINGPRFRTDISEYITDGYSSSIYREIAFRVMEQIDNDISAFVNSRVDERLRELGVIPSN